MRVVDAVLPVSPGSSGSLIVLYVDLIIIHNHHGLMLTNERHLQKILEVTNWSKVITFI